MDGRIVQYTGKGSSTSRDCKAAPTQSHVEIVNCARREFCPPMLKSGWTPRGKARELLEGGLRAGVVLGKRGVNSMMVM